MQQLQGKSDSLFVDFSYRQHEKEAVANELRRRDLKLQIVKDQFEALVENKLAVESEVESVKSISHVENALMGSEKNCI